MTAPMLPCPECDYPLHTAEPCACDDECCCDDTGWMWWETWPDPPIACPMCGCLSVVDISGETAYASEAMR